MHENLRVGAYGWQSDKWNGGYYPEDLPEEWKLSYYANEFSVVMIPGEYWEPGRGYRIDEWTEDIYDKFRFVIEFPGLKEDIDRVLFDRQYDEFGQYIAGIYFEDENVADSIDIECPKFTSMNNCDGNVCIYLMDNNVENMREVRGSLERFDESANSDEKIVIVGDRHTGETSMEALSKVHALAEMMGL